MKMCGRIIMEAAKIAISICAFQVGEEIAFKIKKAYRARKAQRVDIENNALNRERTKLEAKIRDQIMDEIRPKIDADIKDVDLWIDDGEVILMMRIDVPV